MLHSSISLNKRMIWNIITTRKRTPLPPTQKPYSPQPWWQVDDSYNRPLSSSGGFLPAWSLVEGPPAGPETWGECLWLPLTSVTRVGVFLQLQPSLLHYVFCVPEVVNTRDMHYISHNYFQWSEKHLLIDPLLTGNLALKLRGRLLEQWLPARRRDGHLPNSSSLGHCLCQHSNRRQQWLAAENMAPVPNAWLHSWHHPLLNWMTLGKLPNLSGPLFPHLWDGKNDNESS